MFWNSVFPFTATPVSHTQFILNNILLRKKTFLEERKGGCRLCWLGTSCSNKYIPKHQCLITVKICFSLCNSPVQVYYSAHKWWARDLGFPFVALPSGAAASSSCNGKGMKTWERHTCCLKALAQNGHIISVSIPLVKISHMATPRGKKLGDGVLAGQPLPGNNSGH